MINTMTHEELYIRYRNERDEWTEQFRTRVHRALSWLKRAEREANEPASAFIFLWIAFNAAYARIIDAQEAQTERDKYDSFLGYLVSSDRKKRIATMLFSQYADTMEQLINNKYVFFEYWQRQLYPDANVDWELALSRSVLKANEAEKKGNSYNYLRIVLSRLHVLRNQLIHGAATWNGKTNLQQVQDAAMVMRQFVPLMIDVMMDNPDAEEWGDVLYPVQ